MDHLSEPDRGNRVQRRIILHAGLPKCGSTGLQWRLASNRAALAEYGIFVPTAHPGHPGGLQQMALATALVAASRPKETGICPMLIDTIAEFTATGLHMMVLSSESFSIRAHKLRAVAFGDALAPFAVDLLLYLRRHDRWMESYYKQCVRVAPRLFNGSFARFIDDPPPYAQNLGGRMIARATAALADLTGADTVHVVDLDRATGGSIATMAALLDAPLATMPDDPALLPAYYATLASHGLPANASLSDVATGFLAAIDRSAWQPGMLLDLDVALATTAIDDCAPGFRLLGKDLSDRLIAAGDPDRQALLRRYGVALPDPTPAVASGREALTPVEWRVIADRIMPGLTPTTKAGLAAAYR